jgi:hypothetical protein
MKAILNYLSQRLYCPKLRGLRRLLNTLTLRVGIIAAAIFAVPHDAAAQGYYQHYTADEMFSVSGGIAHNYIDNAAFDQWTRANYNLTERYTQDYFLNLDYIFGRNSVGIIGTFTKPVDSFSGYYGRRLTGDNSPIGSWLNFEFGFNQGFFKNIAPVNYTPTPAQQGQNLELHYNSLLVGLSTRNYLNFLQFNIKIGRGHIPVNTGVYASLKWQPFSRTWSYGYYDQDTVFRSVKITSIPKLGKIQGTAGVFVGF